MRILITGGAGFIGSHTANELVLQGHEVTVFDNLLAQVHASSTEFPEYLHPSINKILGDIRDRKELAKAIENQDAIYHFASLTGVGQSMYEIKEYIDVNITGTATLIEALIHCKNKPKKIILSSSRAVYGEGTFVCPNHPEENKGSRNTENLSKGIFDMLCPKCSKKMTEIPVTEIHEQKPISIYAETKKNQEDYLKYLAQYYKIPVTILRYFNVYGSKQSLRNPYTGILTVFYNQIQNNQQISIYENGKPTRDFVHINDVVQANLLALNYEHQGFEDFNIGSGQNFSIKFAAELLVQACGKTTPIVYTSDYRAGDILACTADISKANKKLGYSPRTKLRNGINEFVAWANTEKLIQSTDTSTKELNKHNLLRNLVWQN